MSEEKSNTVTTNVPALACAAIKELLAKALVRLPSGMEAAAPVYQTLDHVLEHLGRSAVDGADRTIMISIRHIDDGEASINVKSVLHLPPEGEVGVRH